MRQGVVSLSLTLREALLGGRFSIMVMVGQAQDVFEVACRSIWLQHGMLHFLNLLHGWNLSNSGVDHQIGYGAVI